MDKGFEFLGSSAVIWIFRYILVVIIFSVIFNFGMKELTIIHNTRYAEANMITRSLLLNPDGIIYSFGTRTYPGVIDCKKLNEIVLNRTYNQGKKNMIAMNLSLYNLKGNLIKKAFYNKKYYLIWHELAKTGLQGSQGAFSVSRTAYVTLRNCKQKQGILRIEITKPNKI